MWFDWLGKYLWKCMMQSTSNYEKMILKLNFKNELKLIFIWKYGTLKFHNYFQQTLWYHIKARPSAAISYQWFHYVLLIMQKFRKFAVWRSFNGSIFYEMKILIVNSKWNRDIDSKCIVKSVVYKLQKK